MVKKIIPSFFIFCLDFTKSMQYCLCEVNNQFQQVNDICNVSIEIITFNNYTKEELNMMVVKHSEINVTYCDGYILEFDKVNVHAIIPNMLVFNKN